MEKLELKNLFEAIKKDDIKSFSSIMLSNSDLNICYGRFPILSLCYLYGSYRILEKYEKLLLPIHNYVIVDEYYDIYLRFKKYAKKCLKIYVQTDRIVYPIEMLAVLDERYILNKYYNLLYKNDEILANLQKIYKINKNIEVDISRQDIVVPQKKLSLKQKILTTVAISVAVIMAVVSCFGMVFVKNKFGIGSATNPIRISTEAELQKAISKGVRCYKLEKDIVLTTEWQPDDFKGAIYGDGHTIVAGNYLSDGFVKNLSGVIQDLKIETAFEEKSISQNYGIIAQKSTGNIVNCEIFGEFNLKAYNDDAIYVSVFVAQNTGVIDGCYADVSAEIKNKGQADVFFSVFAGINDGEVKNSKTDKGIVVADTVDIGGIVALNNGEVYGCENNIKISQTSSKEWHPNTAGVCMTNKGTIEDCKNMADISAESTKDTSLDGTEFAVIVGGVVCDNYGKVINCRNVGKVSGKGVISIVYAGGIAARNVLDDDYAIVKRSKAESNIDAFSKNNVVFVGGVAGYNSSEVENCGFIGSISAVSEATLSSAITYAGGVVGYNRECMLQDSYAQVTFVNLDKVQGKENCLRGGIAGCLGTVAYQSFDFSNYTAYGLKYVENNHFVLNASFDNPAVGIRSYVSFGEVAWSEYVNVSADNELMVAHQSLAGLGVLIND